MQGTAAFFYSVSLSDELITVVSDTWTELSGFEDS